MHSLDNREIGNALQPSLRTGGSLLAAEAVSARFMQPGGQPSSVCFSERLSSSSAHYATVLRPWQPQESCPHPLGTCFRVQLVQHAKGALLVGRKADSIGTDLDPNADVDGNALR